LHSLRRTTGLLLDPYWANLDVVVARNRFWRRAGMCGGIY
jgi:hypothetical protein